MTKQSKYTQRQWDRTVGWGTVPDEYSHISTDSTDGQDSKTSEESREKVYRTVREIQEEWTKDGIAESNPRETHDIP